MLYCKTLLLLLRCDMGMVRDRSGGMGGLRCMGRGNSAITNV